jgi:hypothetical protein
MPSSYTTKCARWYSSVTEREQRIPSVKLSPLRSSSLEVLYVKAFLPTDSCFPHAAVQQTLRVWAYPLLQLLQV